MNRARLIIIILLCNSILMNCEDQDFDDTFSGDREYPEIIILPKNPDSMDHILAVESICGYETDVILDFADSLIKYKRYLNSAVMMPCKPGFDTTDIGVLPSGNYYLVRCIIDRNHFITDSIFLIDTTAFSVH